MHNLPRNDSSSKTNVIGLSYDIEIYVKVSEEIFFKLNIKKNIPKIDKSFYKIETWLT